MHVDKSKPLFKKEPEALVAIFSKKLVPADTVLMASPHSTVVPPTVHRGPNFANNSSNNRSSDINQELNENPNINLISEISFSPCLPLSGIELAIINYVHRARSYNLH